MSERPAQVSPTLDPARGWYVVFAKPRQEALACRQLANQGYEVWLPLHTGWRKRGGLWVPQAAPMFPRYLFLRCTRPQQGIGPVRSTAGVATLVRFGVTPAQLPHAVVEQLQQLAAQLAQHPDVSPFAAGDRVRIASGPLRGLEGIVSRVVRDRVAVMLTLLGAERQVSLAADQLDPSP